MKKMFLSVGLAALGAVSGGCATGGVAVRFAPPPPRYAVVGVAPGPGYVWAEGFWDWRGGRYVWVTGRWMRPPHPGAVWVPAGWVEGRRGYGFHPGHWR